MTEKVKMSTFTVEAMEKAGRPKSDYFEVNGNILSTSLLKKGPL